MANSDQNTSAPVHALTSSNPEHWIGAPVNTTSAHFEIRYGDFMGSDDPLIPIARVGHGDNETINVELITACPDEQLKGLHGELHQYLAGLQEDPQEAGSFKTPWEYLVYHARSTAANLYGDWHWVYIDPNAPPRVEIPLVIDDRSTMWQKIKSFFSG